MITLQVAGRVEYLLQHDVVAVFFCQIRGGVNVVVLMYVVIAELVVLSVCVVVQGAVVAIGQHVQYIVGNLQYAV